MSKNKQLSQDKIDIIMDSFEVLANITFFKTLTREELLFFCSIVDKKIFHKGDIIVKEGSKDSDLYAIGEGEVEVTKRTERGEEYVINVLSGNKSAFFGEVSLFGGEERSATIKSLTDVVLYTIHGKEFTEFCDANPIIGYKVTKAMIPHICRHLQESNKNIITLFNALIEEVEIVAMK